MRFARRGRMGRDLLGELGGEVLDFAGEAAMSGHKRLDAAMLDEAIAHLPPLPERRRETKQHLRVSGRGLNRIGAASWLEVWFGCNLQGV